MSAWKNHFEFVKNTVIERHFNEKTLRTHNAASEICPSILSAFNNKRAQVINCYEKAFASANYDISKKELLVKCGEMFGCLNYGNNEFNLDIWVIADFVHSLHFSCISELTHQQIASLIGNNITEWINTKPFSIPVSKIEISTSAKATPYIILHGDLSERTVGNINKGDRLTLNINDKQHLSLSVSENLSSPRIGLKCEKPKSLSISIMSVPLSQNDTVAIEFYNADIRLIRAK